MHKNRIDDYTKTTIKSIVQALKKNSITDVNEFKSQLQNLMILNQINKSEENDQLLKLFTKLYYLETNDVDNKLILFFYQPNCVSSSNFVHEWNKLLKQFNNLYKMIAINCSDSKNLKLCSKLNVYQYPTIKFVRNNDVFDYFGELNAEDITKTLNSILN